MVALGGVLAALHVPLGNAAACVMHFAIATRRYSWYALGRCIDELQHMCIGCKLLLMGLQGKACSLSLCNEAESGHMLPVSVHRDGIAS